MKLSASCFMVMANFFMVISVFAEGFTAPMGIPPTFATSLELRNYVQKIAQYQPETVALKRRLQKTIAYYKKIHILKSINKNNYSVDCIPFSEQPTLIDKPDWAEALLPAVRGQTENNLAELIKMGNHFDFNSAKQCPFGSVAILRPTKAMLNFEHANKKAAPDTLLPQLHHAGYSHELGADALDDLVSIQTQANQAYFKGPQHQHVENNNADDHSLDQFWFLNRTYQQAIPTYSVEFGIMASAYFTTPASTSIFVFASVDNYGNNSCYNLECSNFVQFPNTPVLGSPTDTSLDYIFQVTHTTLSQYLSSPAYYLTLMTHDPSTTNPANSTNILLGYYADSIYPSASDLPQYFSAGAEVYADDPHNDTLMYGNYMEPYVGYVGSLQIKLTTENGNVFPYYISNGPAPYGVIWRLGQSNS